MKRTVNCLLLVSTLVALVACGGARGTLQFHANGEDFVRQGFVSKDGWAIAFDHVYVTLSDVTGYQSSPPYDPHTETEVSAKAKAALPGAHTVDLAEGGRDAEPIFVGEVADAREGHFNAIHWAMTQAASGPAKGYALAIAGTAVKDGQTIQFTIKVENEYEYTCGEYVGDERKGILAKGSTADQEMTFHFDHIFGDGELQMDDDLNIGAPGFEPFARIAEGGTLDVDMAGLKARMEAEAYEKLVDILPTLGLVGEGHCHCEAR